MAGFVTDWPVNSSQCIRSVVSDKIIWQEMLVAEFTVNTRDLPEGNEKTH